MQLITGAWYWLEKPNPYMSNTKKSDPFGVPVTVFNTVQGKTCSKTLLSKNDPFPLFFQACLGLWFCAAETTPESASHTTGVLDMLISPGSALGRCGFYSLSGVAGQNCCYSSTYRNLQLRKEVLWKEGFIRQCQTLELGFSDWMDGTAIRLKRS